MAFAIIQKSTGFDSVLIYGLNNSGHQIFLQHREQMPALPQTFPQLAHIFTEAQITLQSVKDFNSIALVLNGKKSVTLLNWVNSAELQTWRSGSNSP